jgi:hypothetical protein
VVWVPGCVCGSRLELRWCCLSGCGFRRGLGEFADRSLEARGDDDAVETEPEEERQAEGGESEDDGVGVSESDAEGVGEFDGEDGKGANGLASLLVRKFEQDVSVLELKRCFAGELASHTAPVRLRKRGPRRLVPVTDVELPAHEEPDEAKDDQDECGTAADELQGVLRVSVEERE